MLKHGLKLVTFRISSSIPVYEGGMLCCLTLGEYRILEKAIVGVAVSKEKEVNLSLSYPRVLPLLIKIDLNFQLYLHTKISYI